MEELRSSFLDTVSEPAVTDPDDRHDEAQQSTDSDSVRTARGIRHGVFRAATLQDKLLERLLSQVIPADDSNGRVPDLTADDMPAYAERPGFSLPLMAANFRRFNARIGVVFKFQARALRVLSWRRPTQTLSLLAVYTFVCLDPYLLLALPLAIALFGILVPSFVARHPAPSSEPDQPAKELSRAFLRNMGDLQNVMDDFSVAHDKIVALVVPVTNFSDEALSSAVFVVLSGACLVMLIAAHLLPLRFIALVGGWAGILSGHPAVARWIRQAKAQYTAAAATTTTTTNNNSNNNNAKAASAPAKSTTPWYSPTALLQSLLSDIQLDSAPETREVEIFELQRRTFPSSSTIPASSHPPSPSPSSAGRDSAGEWQPWLFSPSPYDPLSAARLAGERPRGARFFEDVRPPDGWEWSEKKWALDLWSREWVEERIITGVEVETEGERWVYDMWTPGDDAAAAGGGGGGGGGGEWEGAGEGQGQRSAPPRPGVSWEEGEEEGMGRRGLWRRRRWVRTVKRKKVTDV
ncbi:5f9bd021-dd23-429d-817f-930aa11fefcc [Thermothielavioides terrestris]|uniref:5f9bd021-dd23-429d-817f-930aa11fefcc n=1 Tax=Thermothielavioides terrestris TaxID=2587410 RepID=A0A3S4B5E5_9PEZI|nr:5f9bd021-dd23-429d-817f-930aa11fefcc [Thermothielavioides terrestris]